MCDFPKDDMPKRAFPKIEIPDNFDELSGFDKARAMGLNPIRKTPEELEVARQAYLREQPWECFYGIKGCDEGFIGDKKCRCYYSKDLPNSMRQLGRVIPIEHLGKTFDDIDTSLYKEQEVYAITAIKKAKEYVEYFNDVFYEHGRGLFIWSNKAGSGKTLLSCIIAQEIQNRSYTTVMYSSLGNMFRDIQSTFDNKNLSSTEVLKHYYNSDLLIVDDWGRESGTRWATEQVWNLVQTRYEKKKPIIITSNVNMDVLSQNYNDAIVSRFTQKLEEIKMPEIDLRDVVGNQELEMLKKIIAEKKKGE